MLIEEDFDIIAKGYDLFLKIKNEYALNASDYFVIFPDNNNDINKIALDNLSILKGRKYIDRFFIVINENYKIVDLNRNDVFIYKLCKDEMKALIMLYKLAGFFSNVVVVSNEMPFGSKGVIGKKNITIEDYVVDAIFW